MRRLADRPGRLAVAALLFVSSAGAGAHAASSRSSVASPAVRAAASSPARVYPSGVAGALRVKATPSGQGFFLLTADGQVHGFGDAVVSGSAHLAHPAVTLAVTRTGHGYWVFDANGCTAAFGDAAQFTQSICAKVLNGPVLDAAATRDGNGYWLVANDGGLFSFGDAPFLGSMGGKALNAPVVGMAPAPAGNGYWEVATDGGVFAFAAPFLGSTGALRLNRPVVGMVASGTGYLTVGADGGIFNFGNPFFGSLGASPPPASVVATAPSLDASGNPNGYWMLDAAGNVYAFGAAWLPPGSGRVPGPGAPTLTPSPTPAFADDAPDPDVIRVGSSYYTYTTGTTWGNRIGVLTSSSPTSGWHTLTGTSFGSTALAGAPAWQQTNTQTSPGVYQWGGRFIMFYDAIDSASGRYCLSVATSTAADVAFHDQSSGPFECQAALGGSIDPSPFVDGNGTPWLLWKNNDGSSPAVSSVWAAPLAADGATLSGTPQVVMSKDSAAHPWETTVDDPQMVLVNGTHYLFFTGGDWQSPNYAVGFAVCAAVTGPCNQPQPGPILSSYGQVAGPGGGSLVSDGSGNWWLAYAAWTAGCTSYGCHGKRQLYISSIMFP